LDSQKEYWANKEKEVEETFLELEEQVTCAVQKPVPKQKMEKREEERASTTLLRSLCKICSRASS